MPKLYNDSCEKLNILFAMKKLVQKNLKLDETKNKS